MTWLIGIASALLSGYSIFVCCPFDSEIINIVCRVVFVLAANILLMFARKEEDKLKSRIKALEDKLNDKEKLK